MINRAQVTEALAATESVLEELAPDLAQAYIDALDRIDALETLTAHYRAGSRPTEKLLNRLAETKAKFT